MRKICIIIVLLLLVFFRINAQDCTGTNWDEKQVLKMVNSLPEVIKENEHRSKAHNVSFLKAYIQNTPTKADKHYYVTISEEKGGRLFTYDWYKVDSRTHLISYYDVINDRTISLKEWRQGLKNKLKRKITN